MAHTVQLPPIPSRITKQQISAPIPSSSIRTLTRQVSLPSKPASCSNTPSGRWTVLLNTFENLQELHEKVANKGNIIDLPVDLIEAIKSQYRIIWKEVTSCKTFLLSARETEKKIVALEKSKNFLNEAQQNSLRFEILQLQRRLRESEKVNKEILQLKSSSSYLSPGEIDVTFNWLRTIEKFLKEIKSPKTVDASQNQLDTNLEAILKVQVEARSELECIVCQDIPKQPIQMLSCLENHLFCSGCFDKGKFLTCPMCRQDFSINPPKRNKLAEKMIEKLC